MARNTEQTNEHLHKFRVNKTEVAVFLIGGIKLVGHIKDIDDEGIIFNNDQLIMRNAIATVQPAR